MSRRGSSDAQAAKICLPGIGVHGTSLDPGSDPAFRSRQYWHEEDGGGSND